MKYIMPYASLCRQGADTFYIHIGSMVGNTIMSDWKKVDISRRGDYLVLEPGGGFPIIGRDWKNRKTQIFVTPLVSKVGLVHKEYFDGSRYRVKKTKDGKVCICLSEKINKEGEDNE